MRRVLPVVEARDEHADALIEAADPAPPVDAGTGAEAEEWVCGECARVLMRRTGQGSDPRAPEPGQTARRVLIECPTCAALNVVPPAGGPPAA